MGTRAHLRIKGERGEESGGILGRHVLSMSVVLSVSVEGAMQCQMTC